ncbi:putative lipopolysaccharide assembly protein A [Leminorella grimontii]|uniref:Lipopolysaccharide assembly protein A n=1 Tax=Leminorella grimontii TaxID=82981 RepID=A0AAV5MXE8_9GAMM|nr:lipopolysaccharide assembly protein LapA domain-containing protein [Leminorella grimontii]KFC96293.1 inner membrane protein [Leminorella grimontii ATCC 33999 = DSM 5078]GKX54516.1 putative lipopolysaccharide assembly protein A [Leminorella grimontii]GKX57933.1 putative lipopolysaccharide assembly protein A [Leminorella grimontii]VFS59037.1 Inner membrane protein yciS [Leminorella grimontii]
MKYLLIGLIAVVILVIAVTLGAHNEQVVTFNFLIAKGDYALSTLLAVLFGGGFILGWLVTGIFYLRLRLRLGRAMRQIKRLQNETTAPVEAAPVMQQIAEKE